MEPTSAPDVLSAAPSAVDPETPTSAEHDPATEARVATIVTRWRQELAAVRIGHFPSTNTFLGSQRESDLISTRWSWSGRVALMTFDRNVSVSNPEAYRSAEGVSGYLVGPANEVDISAEMREATYCGNPDARFYQVDLGPDGSDLIYLAVINTEDYDPGMKGVFRLQGETLVRVDSGSCRWLEVMGGPCGRGITCDGLTFWVNPGQERCLARLQDLERAVLAARRALRLAPIHFSLAHPNAGRPCTPSASIRSRLEAILLQSRLHGVSSAVARDYHDIAEADLPERLRPALERGIRQRFATEWNGARFTCFTGRRDQDFSFHLHNRGYFYDGESMTPVNMPRSSAAHAPAQTVVPTPEDEGRWLREALQANYDDGFRRCDALPCAFVSDHSERITCEPVLIGTHGGQAIVWSPGPDSGSFWALPRRSGPMSERFAALVADTDRELVYERFLQYDTFFYQYFQEDAIGQEHIVLELIEHLHIEGANALVHALALETPPPG